MGRRRAKMLGLLGAGVSLVLLAAYGLPGWLPAVFSAAGAAPPPLTGTAVRVSQPITISAGGELASAEAVEIICEVEGAEGIKIIEMLTEGTVVEAGDAVIKLDPSQIRGNLAQQRIKVTQANGVARAAAEELKIQKNLAAGQIAAAELNLKLAELDREKYVKGEYQAEHNDLQGSIALAEAELQDAQAEVAHFRNLVKKGFSTPEQLRSKEQAVKRAEHNLSRDTERLNVLQKYTRQRQVVELEANAQEAVRELERARGSAAAAIAKAETDLEIAQATADLEQQQLQRIQRQLDLCDVTAPAGGTVVYAKEKNKAIELGATVRYKQKLFSIPSSQRLKVNAFVHESVVKQVKPGMPVEVRIDAFADQTLIGTVQDVASFYDSTRHWLSGGVKEYATTIAIQKADGITARSGMTAEVRIEVARLDQSLTVPVSAITQVDNQYYCFVVEDKGVSPRRLSLGMIADDLVEVTQGLEEGAQVALDARRRAADLKRGTTPEDSLSAR